VRSAGGAPSRWWAVNAATCVHEVTHRNGIHAIGERGPSSKTVPVTSLAAMEVIAA
jgi:hypothetical protein